MEKHEQDNFEVRHPLCVSNKSNCKVYAYIVKTTMYWVVRYLLYVKHNYMFRPQIFAIIRWPK